MIKQSGEETSLKAMQKKVSSLLESIFMSLNGLVEYLNRTGGRCDDETKRTISQLVTALSAVEFTEKRELAILNSLKGINQRLNGAVFDLRTLLVEEEQLRHELRMLTQRVKTFDRQTLSGIFGSLLLLENDIKKLIGIVNVDLKNELPDS